MAICIIITQKMLVEMFDVHMPAVSIILTFYLKSIGEDDEMLFPQK